MINKSNDEENIADFSSDDVLGFALCVIMWRGMVGPQKINPLEKKLLNFMIDYLDLSPDQENKIKDFWETMDNSYDFTLQYRNAKQYSDYKTISWDIPDNAQIVMLGDWGTSLDDAHAFLKAIWKQAYLNNPGGPIVFIHLGDIYYCGLPYECQHYFYEVFTNVGQQLQNELGNDFNPNPPIFTLPGNHEYYSYGYGYFELLDTLNQNVPGINYADIYQQCSFFCLQTANGNWQFLGMDTGRDDGNALLSALQAAGDAAKAWLDQELPDWSWIKWVENLAHSTYEDYVGPFQPTLDQDEVNWLKERLNNFDGKTIMLSHHQLFSREAEINQNSPEYMNTWLDDNFSYYYKNKIAAWYWGHEHSFAVYLDGLMGLNKGRLLGSSSYEATEEKDTPYENNYPMIAWAPNMDETLIKNENGLYYHAGAIMRQSNDEMAVKYYQFPAWTQLDAPPSNPQLEEITAVAEQITTTFAPSLRPSWIGDEPIKQDKVTTDKSPSITTWNGRLYMLYADGSSTTHLKICTANAVEFQPENRNAKLDWNGPVEIKVNTNSVKPMNSPAIIAVNGNLYGFYIAENDDKRHLQIITTQATDNPTNWAPIGGNNLQVGDAAPAVCFFQGRIYIVYRESGSDNDLRWAYLDITSNSLHNFGTLKDANGKKFESPNTPALAADAYHIYLAYQHKKESGFESGTDICWAVGTPSGPAPASGSNNITWNDKGKIESPGVKTGEIKNPDTNIGLTLEYADGLFLLVYTSTNNNLTQSALRDTGKDTTGEWIGNNTVKTKVNTGDPSYVRSATAPALAITSGGGFLVYRGKDHDEIYWAYY